MAEAAEKIIDLNGEYRYKVDAKGRMSIPSAFRKVLATDLVVTPDPHDECLYVFEPQSFNCWVANAFVDKFGKYDSSNPQHVALRSLLKARAANVESDGAGRVMLAAKQREAVGIDKDVVVVGNTGYFEIWDAKRYDEKMSQVDLSLLFG